MSMLINLLPDLRQAKLKETRRRQLATGISVAVWVICAGIVGVLVIYMTGQKVVISQYSSKIIDEKKQLEEVPDLLKALTATQHLASLPNLYNQRVYLTKFFKAYSAANPLSTTISSLTIDDQSGLLISGASVSYAEVAKLARALGSSNVTLGEGATASNPPYFTNVDITSVTSTKQSEITFTIKAILSSGVTSGTN